ncbi:GPO family capsid scaffolding protein [Aliivibrio fischeri]|uniref:GPO family capsid scaffolding protein n=1 Tax=Aliivibrio fischeri TaxID=668 RepID=UPI00080DF527|nr:GPO family capsid scaffolding protein [Aliivibrio fischeri]OCH02180.1 phage capsid protein [Aliivibrio fischeri]
MFQSEPICILTAGETVDGRFIEQKVIDDIVELYDPKRYNARINEEHWAWGEKFGSVLSVEKRGDELWGVLKPNSLLLSTVEKGQLLHTSCEITPNFANTGKSYLTGLALTDEPASLGTTEMHLSANSKEKNKDKVYLSSGATVGKELIEAEEPATQDDKKLLSRLIQLFRSHDEPSDPPEEENDDMNEELKDLLQAQTAQITALTSQVTSLTATIKETLPQETELEQEEQTELAYQVEALSSKLDDVVTKLSSITDETPRQLAGEDSEETYL